jgi:hypothetical protein
MEHVKLMSTCIVSKRLHDSVGLSSSNMREQSLKSSIATLFFLLLLKFM